MAASKPIMLKIVRRGQSCIFFESVLAKKVRTDPAPAVTDGIEVRGFCGWKKRLSRQCAARGFRVVNPWRRHRAGRGRARGSVLLPPRQPGHSRADGKGRNWRYQE